MTMPNTNNCKMIIKTTRFCHRPNPQVAAADRWVDGEPPAKKMQPTCVFDQPVGPLSDVTHPIGPLSDGTVAFGTLG